MDKDEATQWRNVRSDQAVIDRSRFERLLTVGAAADAFERFLEDPELDRLRDAVLALQSGDLDPLP